MKKFLIVLYSGIFLLGCNNGEKEKQQTKDNMRMLYRDSVNVVKLTDKLVIYESTCRGCAYESSTRFEINDPFNIVKLQDIITTDNSPQDMDGGSISKDLIITPLKTGSTTIRLYKTWGAETAKRDSSKYTSYIIDVRN